MKHSIANRTPWVVTKITEHLAKLNHRVTTAVTNAGRSENCVNILAVSKQHPASVVESALIAGLTDFGENHVHEGIEKIRLAGNKATWHFIGQIQSNKTRQIAGYFDWAQTVCTARIAERLNNQRPQHAANLQVCIQLRPSSAPERSGANSDDIDDLARTIARLPRLDLRGLMIIPLPGLDDAALRQEFRRARQIMESMKQYSDAVDTLSMGMSADLEAAIMEGSTMIRIGTDLFGQRNR